MRSKVDPIIAVRDVHKSAQWYEAVFDCDRKHSGDEFAVISTPNEEVLVCLHKWGEHDHPTMMDADIVPGNGLILYYKTDDLVAVRQNVRELNYPVEDDMHINQNSGKKEFSLRDPDGYYWIVTEFHNYEG